MIFHGSPFMQTDRWPMHRSQTEEPFRLDKKCWWILYKETVFTLYSVHHYTEWMPTLYEEILCKETILERASCHDSLPNISVAWLGSQQDLPSYTVFRWYDIYNEQWLELDPDSLLRFSSKLLMLKQGFFYTTFILKKKQELCDIIILLYNKLRNQWIQTN